MPKYSPFVTLESHSNYVVIKWNRPSRRNAIVSEMCTTFCDYLKQVKEDESIKLVVITGTGNFYSSGADLSFITPDPTNKRNAFSDFFLSLIHFPKPIVVAVNGPAVGVAVTMLPLCDVVYASEDSTFQTPFSRVGVVPESVSSYTFPKIMGYSKASEMLLFNRSFSAAEAKMCGFVSDVFPRESFMTEVHKRIKEFLDNPTLCLIYGKELIRNRERRILIQVEKEESERMSERNGSEDRKQQIRKFFKQREELKQIKKSKL